MKENIGQLIWTISYFTVLIPLAVYGIHRYIILGRYLRLKKNRPEPLSQFRALPRVTVQLPVFNELHVVERLLDSVAALDYPKDLLEIQVLDDSTDETRTIAEAKVRQLSALGFDVVHLHREDRGGYKAGALDAGLGVAKGEFLLILDADFVATPQLLMQTIHYFTDPKVGMIQTRWGHLNRNYSLLTRVQALFLDGHLLLEQTARSRGGFFFNFNGTAGLWRKDCIAAAGGWHHDTLTEDLDLSYRAQLEGWRFVFLPDVVTPAELPVEMNGFKSQQHRWTKGSIQTCRKLLSHVWRAKLPFRVKLEATVHLTSNFTYLLLAILCFLVHPASSASAGTMRTWLLDVPIFLCASVSACVFYVVAAIELNPRGWWRDALCLPFLLALGVGMSLNNARAVLEALFNHQSEFTRTPKYGIVRKGQSWRGGSYLPIKSLFALAELALGFYFLYLSVEALRNGGYVTLAFMMMFAFGFLFVALGSLGQWLPSFQPAKVAAK